MKRFIKFLCISAIFMLVLFAFDKTYYRSDRLYLQGNKYLTDGQYQKAKWAYVAAFNAGSGVQAYGGMLAVHYMSGDDPDDVYNIISKRPADILYDEALLWMNAHMSLVEYDAIVIEKTGDYQFCYYDVNHTLKASETYKGTSLKIKTEIYDENGNVIHMVSNSSASSAGKYNYTDYLYENDLLIKEETVYSKGHDFYEHREQILYFYDENNILTEKHHYTYKCKALLRNQDELAIYIYNNKDYPLVVKTVYEDGSGSIVYSNSDSIYDTRNLAKKEYYDKDWNMTCYIISRWLATPEECGEYRSMGFIDLWSVHEEKRYSPEDTYLGKNIDIHNGFGSWWGTASFDEKDNLIEYVHRYQYQIRASQK